MRRIFSAILATVVLVMLCTACQTKTSGDVKPGETLKFEGMEITVGKELTWESGYDHAIGDCDVVVIPIRFKNVGLKEENLENFAKFILFNPDGDFAKTQSGHTLELAFEVERNGFTPGTITDSEIKLVYVGDGDYRLKFWDSDFPPENRQSGASTAEIVIPIKKP